MDNTVQATDRPLRYAIYTRYSSEMQNEISLEAQERLCREAVVRRNGIVVRVYYDGVRSGWSLDREGFNQLRRDAEREQFDAVIVWKFDRLARNHEHAVMIKVLLRHDYGLKLFCVEGFSEDDDDSPYTAMMEQMLAVFYAFYSQNLSSETKRGKRQRAVNGEFNGSKPPLGYDLVTVEMATPERPAGLHVNPRLAALVRRAFRMYASGQYSDADIAAWLMSRQAIQKHRQGKKPFDKEMVRDMLQNRTYTGRVRHTDTIYKDGGLGKAGKMRGSKRHRSEWFEGRHQGFISDELFNQCQAARAGVVRHRHASSKERIYLLFDRVFCARCVGNKPAGLVDDNYGRMRPKYHNQRGYGYYRCLSHDRGYGRCGQPAIPAREIDAQVVWILTHLAIPDGFKERVKAAIRSRVENAAATQRMEEIKAIISRIDFRWDQGFISKEEYIEKRQQLDLEVSALQPLDYDELIEAADLLTSFKTYWDVCQQVEGAEARQQQLISKIVERVFVHEDKVIALTLYGNFGVILAENGTASYLAAEAVAENLLSKG